jgi:hypothetical protein
MPCSLELTDVSEGHVASIFRIDEQANQETSVKQAVSSSLSFKGVELFITTTLKTSKPTKFTAFMKLFKVKFAVLTSHTVILQAASGSATRVLFHACALWYRLLRISFRVTVCIYEILHPSISSVAKEDYHPINKANTVCFDFILGLCKFFHATCKFI